VGEATKIQWAHHTWSPWRGCQKVSEGCRNCYAEALSHRNPAVLGEWGPEGARVVNKDWRKPLQWDAQAGEAGERRRVFPSLCDVFEDRDELEEVRRKFFVLIEATPALDWLILTKRPAFAREWLERWAKAGGYWPARNVWLGTSVENQDTADQRIPDLFKIHAAVRWLSAEPLLGPIDLSSLMPRDPRPVIDRRILNGTLRPDHTTFAEIAQWQARRINWVVIGGESGPNARPCDLGWIRSLVGQCLTAEVPVFVKQLGSRPVLDGLAYPAVHPKGGNPDEWPEDLRIREFLSPV
jgi:protein gp37